METSALKRLINRMLPKSWRSSVVTIPVVRLHGAIMAGGGQLRPSLSLASSAGLIEKAFAFDAPAVAFSVNSPGGSPVQSRLIFKRIRDLAVEKNKKVLVFVEDVAASGGYMIAAAGDEIIADPSSIVGSIGVVSASFGFPELMKKIGVERRVHTAGKNKSVLDPFKPEKKEDIERLKALQLEVHDTFIDLVKEPARRQAEGRPGYVHRPVLDRQEGAGTRPCRCAGRHALGAEGALRTQDPAQADQRPARPAFALLAVRLENFGIPNCRVAPPMVSSMRHKNARCGRASVFDRSRGKPIRMMQATRPNRPRVTDAVPEEF